jgi:hypothetical protein
MCRSSVPTSGEHLVADPAEEQQLPLYQLTCCANSNTTPGLINLMIQADMATPMCPMWAERDHTTDVTRSWPATGGAPG